jgi:hypothetical protein
LKSFPGWVAQPEVNYERVNAAIEMSVGPDGDPKFLAAFQKEVN